MPPLQKSWGDSTHKNPHKCVPQLARDHVGLHIHWLAHPFPKDIGKKDSSNKQKYVLVTERGIDQRRKMSVSNQSQFINAILTISILMWLFPYFYLSIPPSFGSLCKETQPSGGCVWTGSLQDQGKGAAGVFDLIGLRNSYFLIVSLRPWIISFLF